MRTVMSEELSTTTRIQRFVDCFNRQDIDSLVAKVTPGVVWEDPGTAKSIVGREALGQHLLRLMAALPDLRIVRDDYEVFRGEPGRMAVAWHLVGTMTGRLVPPGFAPTGKTIDVRGASFMMFEGELLAHHRLIYDVLDATRQLGAFPDSRIGYRIVTSPQHLKAWLVRPGDDEA